MSDDANRDSRQSGWERDALTQLAGAALHEQRRSRRWSVFFRLAFLVYLLTITFMLLPDLPSTGSAGDKKHTAMVRLEGVISSSSDANAERVIKGLKNAFANPSRLTVGANKLRYSAEARCWHFIGME